MAAEPTATPQPLALPDELMLQARGPFAGQLEDLNAERGLCGWAIDRQQDQPLTLLLSVEDLLDPSRQWKLVELTADQYRSDLAGLGLAIPCGFRFQGHNGRELPEASPGLVLRAFFDAQRRFELPGSPLRLDAERYQLLRQLCRTGLGRDACLGPVRGPFLAGWAIGAGPYQLRIDGGEPLALHPPEPLPSHEWPLNLPLPRSAATAKSTTSAWSAAMAAASMKALMWCSPSSPPGMPCSSMAGPHSPISLRP